MAEWNGGKKGGRYEWAFAAHQPRAADVEGGGEGNAVRSARGEGGWEGALRRVDGWRVERELSVRCASGAK